MVHGAVGLDQPLLGAPARLVLADADADTDRQRNSFHLERRLHGGPDLLGDDVGLRLIMARQQQHELVAGQSGEEVLWPEAAADPLRQLAEEGITVAVAEVVVDLLEVVEIAKQQAAGAGPLTWALSRSIRLSRLGRPVSGSRRASCQISPPAGGAGRSRD